MVLGAGGAHSRTGLQGNIQGLHRHKHRHRQMLIQEALGTDEDERPAGDGEPMGSLLIYPGCKVVIFSKVV